MLHKLIGLLSVFFVIIGGLWAIIPGGFLPINKKLEGIGGLLFKIGLLGLVISSLISWWLGVVAK